MGFLDDVQASISRGTEAVGRGTKNTQLKMRQNDLLKERQNLAAQLGAALYERFKNDPTMRTGLEALFDGIAAVDVQRAEIQAQIDALAAEAQASQAAAMVYSCPGCGAKVPATDLFCSGCGKPIDEIKAASPAPMAPSSSQGPACPSCGAPLEEGDAFCMSCGARVDMPAAGGSEASAATNDMQPSMPPVANAAYNASEEAATTDGNACPGCGAAVTKDDVFCGSCGYSLQGA